MYPEGQTPQGIFDMAGNVWEWCLNKHGDPNDTAVGGYDSRVVRGGSWSDGQGYARASDRSLNHPGGRDYRVGFGLCCVSPIER